MKLKVVLLAGGFGTRFSEESVYKPKPLVEIGGKPILWHIMKEYAFYGHNEFIICAGYKQESIKEWFSNYFLNCSDVTFDYRDGRDERVVLECRAEPWKVTVADTGLYTMTGGRIKRIQRYVGDEPFLMTYTLVTQQFISPAIHSIWVYTIFTGNLRWRLCTTAVLFDCLLLLFL